MLSHRLTGPFRSPERAVSRGKGPFPRTSTARLGAQEHPASRGHRSAQLPVWSWRQRASGGQASSHRSLSCSHSTEGRGLPRSTRSNLSRCGESWPKPGYHPTQKQQRAGERPGTRHTEARPSVHAVPLPHPDPTLPSEGSTLPALNRRGKGTQQRKGSISAHVGNP